MARFVLALIAIVAIATSAQAALSAQQVVSMLEFRTEISKGIQPLARNIAFGDGLPDGLSSGHFPRILSALYKNIYGFTADVEAFKEPDTRPFGKNESSSIIASFQNFTTVHLTLIEILADKAALFNESEEIQTFSFIRDEMAKGLREDRGALDAWVSKLIDLCESQAEQIKKLQTRLKATLTAAINSYAIPHGLAVPANADSVEASSAAQLVESTLKQLTAYSQDLQPVATSSNAINGPLIVIGQGPYPKIIGGFTQIVTTTSTFLAAFEGASPFDKDESTSVRAAFQTFVTVHQALLQILANKAALFTAQPFIGQPVAGVLRQDEDVLDTLAFKLINVCKSQAEEMKKLSASLGASLANAVKSYAPDGLVNVI